MTNLLCGITGADGMLGWHLRCALVGHPKIHVRLATRQTFSSPDSLQEFCEGLDVLVHFAGMNRGDKDEIFNTNVGLGEQVLAACHTSNTKPQLFFANSTHVHRDTAYGRSKAKLAEMFYQWSQKEGVVFHNLILPHVFGEGGKPFYNSVVHTFCHQIATGEEPQIDQDGDLELLHAGAVADLILDRMSKTCATEDLRVQGTGCKVSQLLERLQGYAQLYCEQQIFPNLEEDLDRDLFNVLRYFLYPQHYPVALTLHADERGSLFEAVKGKQGGQCFVSTTRPGVTRGNHFHRRKVERFLVVQGEAVVRVRKLFSQETREFFVDGATPVFLDMPTLHTHSITNVGSSDLLTLFWAHEIFNPETPDTWWEEV